MLGDETEIHTASEHSVLGSGNCGCLHLGLGHMQFSAGFPQSPGFHPHSTLILAELPDSRQCPASISLFTWSNPNLPRMLWVITTSLLAEQCGGLNSCLICYLAWQASAPPPPHRMRGSWISSTSIPQSSPLTIIPNTTHMWRQWNCCFANTHLRISYYKY